MGPEDLKQKRNWNLALRTVKRRENRIIIKKKNPKPKPQNIKHSVFSQDSSKLLYIKHVEFRSEFLKTQSSYFKLSTSLLFALLHFPCISLDSFFSKRDC